MTTEIAKTNANTALITNDVEHGGLTGKDLEIPRATLLQPTSPDLQEYAELKAGQYINSVTKEVLTGPFAPLFAFKQYAKFNEEGKMEWSTVNRNDPRVVEGLQWVDDQRPAVTEFLNVMVVFKSNPELPLILSFKSTALRVGKQFMTLVSMKGKPSYHFWYELSTKLNKKGSQSWYSPIVKMVTPTEDHKVSEEDIAQFAAMASSYSPIVRNMPVDAAEATEEAPF